MQINRMYAGLAALATVVPALVFIAEILPTPVFSDELREVREVHARDTTDIWTRQLKSTRASYYMLLRKEHEASASGPVPEFYAKEKAGLEAEIEQLKSNIDRATKVISPQHTQN